MSEYKMSKKIQKISKETDRIAEDCFHSGKSHLNSADTWNRVHYCLGIPAAVLATIAAADFFEGTIESSIFAMIAAALVAVSTFLNPSKKASKHEVAGNQYLALAKSVERFKEIDVDGATDENWIRTRLEEFAERRDALNENSSNPLRSAFTKAKAGIDAGETNYRVDRDGKR